MSFGSRFLELWDEVQSPTDPIQETGSGRETGVVGTYRHDSPPILYPRLQ